jgi:hypothetical protein
MECRRSLRRPEFCPAASILFLIVVGYRPLEKMDARSSCAERSLIVGDASPGCVPDFVSQLLLSGLLTNPDERPTVDVVMKQLEKNRFRIAEEIDSEALSAFDSSLEASAP